MLGKKDLKPRQSAVESVRALVREVVNKDASERLRYASGEGPSPQLNAACIHIVVGTSSNERRTLVLADSESGKALEQLISRSWNLHQQICPARDDMPRRENLCSQPAWSYYYRSSEGCDYRHTVEGYADGTLHYYVRGLRDQDVYSRGKKIDKAVAKEITRGLVGETIGNGPTSFFADAATTLHGRVMPVLLLSMTPTQHTCSDSSTPLPSAAMWVR